MNKPFKFRYVNELTGAFVIAIVTLLVVGVLLAGRAQHWFETVYELRIDFPQEGTFGLQKGAEIDILGTVVGTVDRIEVLENDRLQAVLNIRGDFIRFIHTDSEAVIKRKFGVAGDAFIDISVGQGQPIDMTHSPTLTCRKDTELLEIVQQVIEQIQQATLPAIEELQNTLKEYRLLAVDMRNPEGTLQQTLASTHATVTQVNTLIAGLERGEGTAGMLLKDPTIAHDVQQILGQVDKAMTQLNDAFHQVQGILDNVKQGTDIVPEVADTVRDELRDIPGMVLQARATLHESEKLLEGLQDHWLLRSAMQADHPLEALPVDAVQMNGVTHEK